MIEKILAEIERQIKEHKKALRKKDNTLVTEAMLKGSLSAYESLSRFIESLEKEQDVDFEKEEDWLFNNYGWECLEDIDTVVFAKHFYELGCRHAAVLYDDIEYERQRRQEEEKSEIPTIKGWVARDECLCFFQGEKPQLSKETKLWYNTEYEPIYLDESLLQDVQLENSPVEVELTISRVVK